MSKMITLREAFDQWQRETGFANAYDWYRRAASDGRKIFGDHASARKVGRTWMIDFSDLERALGAHKAEAAEIVRTTADYGRHILRGRPGDSVRVTWGSYAVHDGFHMTTALNLDPSGNWESWYCSTCWEIAATEHDKPECPTCSDWNGCGRDCTLSRVFCRKCGTSLSR